MFYLRFFLYAIILAVSPSFVFANLETITSVIAIKDHVDSLLVQGVKSEDIVVVWDCHGVITAQGAPKNGVKMTLTPHVLDVIEYFNTKKIPQIIATAWHDPYEVQKDLVRLKVAPYFEAENIERGNLEIVALGKNKSVVLEGHKFGRLTALRVNENNPSHYFRKKAFGAEWCFPENNFKHIIFVEDDKLNLGMFERDFKNTIYYNDEEDMKKLSLYHFSPVLSKVELKPRYDTFPSHSGSDEDAF